RRGECLSASGLGKVPAREAASQLCLAETWRTHQIRAQICPAASHCSFALCLTWRLSPGADAIEIHSARGAAPGLPRFSVRLSICPAQSCIDRGNPVVSDNWYHWGKDQGARADCVLSPL